MKTFIYSFLAVINGYFAVTNWPHPLAVVNAVLALWMFVIAVQTIKASE